MDIVFIGLQGHVLALDKASGTPRWRTYLDGGSLTNASVPAFVSLATDGTYVFAHARGKLYCLEAASGRIVWVDPLAGLGYGTATLCALADSPQADAAVIRQRARREEASQ